MQNPIIKRIEYTELDTCAKLIRESFGTVAKEFNLTHENCPSNGAFIETSRLQADWDKEKLMFGLYCGPILVGCMILELKNTNVYELEKLAIHPHYRHMGYGSLLLSYALKVAAEAHVSKVTLGIIEENIRLKSWYQTHGFIHTGTAQFAHLPFTVGYMEQSL